MIAEGGPSHYPLPILRRKEPGTKTAREGMGPRLEGKAWDRDWKGRHGTETRREGMGPRLEGKVWNKSLVQGYHSTGHLISSVPTQYITVSRAMGV